VRTSRWAAKTAAVILALDSITQAQEEPTIRHVAANHVQKEVMQRGPRRGC